jgi:hypothetical protein
MWLTFVHFLIPPDLFQGLLVEVLVDLVKEFLPEEHERDAQVLELVALALLDSLFNVVVEQGDDV